MPLRATDFKSVVSAYSTTRPEPNYWEYPLGGDIFEQKKELEAAPGFEPGNKGFAGLRLTTWLCRRAAFNLYAIVAKGRGTCQLNERESETQAIAKYPFSL